MSPTRGSSAPRFPTLAALSLILLVALAARLAAVAVSTERRMDNDSAHLMNVARCFERGQGFANPAAWPAWMKPARLPMPETFKEPAYPFAIAALAKQVGGEFRAGILISLLAGLMLPLATYALARNLGLDRSEATLAGLLVAANPLSVFMSARVTVDSPYPTLLTLGFACAAWRPPEPETGRPFGIDVLTGAIAGLAFLVRGQTLVAVPALALLLLRAPRLRGPRSLAIAAVAAVLTALPFLLRNLRLFGVPFHSDVGSFGIWPYVDHLTFSHGLERPPAPVAFALRHLPEVLHHMVRSAVWFFRVTLPEEVAGNPIWMLPLAIGALLSGRTWRRFPAVWLFLVSTLAFIFAVHWDSRYFVGTVPFWAIIIALGGVWLARQIGPVAVAGPVRVWQLLLTAMLVAFIAQTWAARRELAMGYVPSEMEAAAAWGPFFRARLRPDESVMVVTTSLYSWFADRPTVHLVIADEARFDETLRRLHVRYAALPTSRLAAFAARFPEHRLPRALQLMHVDQSRDLSVFAVRDSLLCPAEGRVRAGTSPEARGAP